MPVKPTKSKQNIKDLEQGAKPAKAGQADQSASPTGLKPWLSFKTGLILITISSIGMGVLTVVQSVPVIGWRDGILYGVLFGGLIWAVFFISQLFFRWLRK